MEPVSCVSPLHGSTLPIRKRRRILSGRPSLGEGLEVRHKARSMPCRPARVWSRSRRGHQRRKAALPPTGGRLAAIRVTRRGAATRTLGKNYEAPAALATGALIASANLGVRTFSSGSPNEGTYFRGAHCRHRVGAPGSRGRLPDPARWPERSICPEWTGAREGCRRHEEWTPSLDRRSLASPSF
jgi:hypothetical protein